MYSLPMKPTLALTLLLAATPVFAQSPDRTQLLLEKLSNAPGPPGAEEAVRAIMVPSRALPVHAS